MTRVAVPTGTNYAIATSSAVATNRVDIGDIAALALTSGSFSVAYWIKPTKNTGSPQFVFAKDNVGQRGYGFGVNGTISPYFERNGVGITAAPFVMQLGNYYHVVTTFDGTNIRYYVNGTQSGGTVATTNPPANTASVNIGRRPYTASEQNFNGNIDEVRVFSTQLTQAQINDLYYNRIVPRTSLVGEWLFNEGSGSTATDTSGQGNNGTITGATYTTDVPMIARSAASSRVGVQDMKAALSFNGAGDFINVTNSSGQVFNNTDCTVSLWFKARSLSATHYLFAHQGSATNNRIYLTYDVNGVLSANMSNAAAGLTGPTIKIGTWYHVVAVYDRSTPAMYMYINGALYTSRTTGISAPGSGLVDVTIGSRLAGAEGTNAIIKDVQVWARQLSATEAFYAYSGTPIATTSLKMRLPFNEGAGTTATDNSGNGNTGTITGATYTADTPMKARLQVGGNLVPNGDFEYAPPFTAATTTTSRFIDGTAAGSSSNSLFGWVFTKSGTASAQFDTSTVYSGKSSLKLSTLATASYIEVFMPSNSGIIIGYFGKTAIPVLPSTSYTYSFRMKTNVTSGSAGGAQISFIDSTGDGTTASRQTNSTAVNTTTDWTLYTGNFTTAATARYLQVNPVLYGHTGAGTLIMDAWIDEIRIVPTTNTTRLSA